MEFAAGTGFIDCHHFTLTELGIERREGNESVISHLANDPILILIGHGGRSKKCAPTPIAHFGAPDFDVVLPTQRKR